MRSILFTTALAAAVLASPAAFSGGLEGKSSPAKEAAGARLDKADREFVEDALQGGILEVKLGQLAVQKGETADVKAFGQRMIDDHTSVNTKLSQLAEQKGLTEPAQPDKKHQDEIDKLAKKTGGDFDKAYLDKMVSDHEDDVKAFEKASKDAKDADLKLLATSTLPTLREHLSQAKEIQDRLKKSH